MISLWNDLETNNYYLINNETGDKQKVYKTADYIKEFDASLTGSVGYKDRIKLAKKPSYMPLKAKSLQKNFVSYTPSINKLVWYSQLPRPTKLPNLEYFKTEKKQKQNHKTQEQKSLLQSQSYQTLPNIQQSTIASQYQSLLDPQQARSISTIQHYDLNDQDHFKEMSHLFESKSYDYKSFNLPPKMNLNCRSIKDFEQSLKEERQQLEMFKLPEQKPQLVNTKGRFPGQLKTAKDFMPEDKTVAKLLYPDLFKEKIIDQKQEELRRKINKLKEQEMLQRNLKNKA
ncbi:unnamed protein product [Paramecium pentaurelia]|uniref:Uncharacterized protein n=1 Tax=Paramecium pentaurelia TaxID=43138 RepID=A0A8S1UJH4_9CILI|nr:unnamed protein product [Paramecium pentaurelia]